MKETSSDQAPRTDRIRSWARSHAHGASNRPTAANSNPDLSLRGQQQQPQQPSAATTEKSSNARSSDALNKQNRSQTSPRHAPTDSNNAAKSTSPASEAEGTGSVLNQGDGEEKKKPNVAMRFYLNTKKILLHSWINLFLVFVPIGIVVANIPGFPPGAIFGLNAVAIIPLAGLLSHATESVARKLGDTIGALLNVTFGNAVELIIFIIALVQNKIRIVQASLLGSILANLLLILGMAMFLGGLRFQEQLYNSTVTQMSACLLSLSVISLVLPTAFHASFSDEVLADERSLKISRGTSVILLIIYVIYLMFQLKSHAYMYESTPQHIIDEESTPGPAAAWLDTSSSDSSSSSDSDSDASSHSRNTMSRRVRRAIRARRRRKSSVASVDTDDGASRTRASSFNTNNASPIQDGSKSGESSKEAKDASGFFPRMHNQGSEEVLEEEDPKSTKSGRRHRHKHSKRKHRRERKTSTPIEPEAPISVVNEEENIAGLLPSDALHADTTNGEPRRVDFADTVTHVEGGAELAPGAGRRPFTNLRGLSFRPVAKSLAPPVFTRAPEPGTPATGTAGPVPRVRYGIRRTNSLPERLNDIQYRPPGAMMPSRVPPNALVEGTGADEAHEDDLTRVAAVVMLLISTALVAVCAEFMVDAIDDVVSESGIGEIFIGLIILPIVGNAAEHVTAVAVAMKNKMDLAIGVAIGSSIQIALFLTPLVVILGWILDRDMTLYFTLFETVCLFVSAFIINFLILDGRSNYLEGALLFSTYIIIAIIAFFYPEGDEASEWSA
ncbi:Sodium/calcium exchanger protein-domain-containing protein [Xylariaceae sp. FL0016]|nr:Sodium/calcium exchanger protein-domain-containing protein [Xylariaceae sp. FL0016]